MKLELLVRGKKALGCCQKTSCPKDITMKIGSYGSNGKNNLHFVSFTARSNELKTAIALADLRDDVLDEQNMRILEDGASAILGEDLFPLFSRFERSLREVLTIAQCAAQDAFDDSFVK